jgi:hypothetical protein
MLHSLTRPLNILGLAAFLLCGQFGALCDHHNLHGSKRLGAGRVISADHQVRRPRSGE